MTLEELQEKVAALESELGEKSAKVGELSKENAKWRRLAQGKDSVDSEEFEKLKTELEEARANLTKIDKLSKSEIEKLNNAVKAKDSALQKFLLDGGLTDALAKAGVKPEYMDATKALLREKAAIKAEGDNYTAVMGDKPLLDAVKEWAASDTGKHFVAAPANSGGGAQGGGQNAANKTISRTEWESRSHAERSSMAKEGYKVVEPN